MATAVAVISIVSAVLTIVSSLTAAGAQMEAAKEKRKLGEKEADLAKEKAEYAQQQHKESIKRLLASQRAQIGASGFMATGTPMEVYVDTKKQAEEALRFEQSSWEKQLKIYQSQIAKEYKYGMIGAALSAFGGAAQGATQFGSIDYGAGPKTGPTTTTTAGKGTAQIGASTFKVPSYWGYGTA